MSNNLTPESLKRLRNENPKLRLEFQIIIDAFKSQSERIAELEEYGSKENKTVCEVVKENNNLQSRLARAEQVIGVCHIAINAFTTLSVSHRHLVPDVAFKAKQALSEWEAK